MAEQNLAEFVNQSGFPLQIGLAALVERTHREHGWRVLYSEHAWRNEAQQTSGFLDLALQDRDGSSVLVIECKRVGESTWALLQPGARIAVRRHAKVWVKAARHFDWFDVALDPRSPQAAYCVVPGQDARSRPMLERVAADVVCATEALAFEERALRFQPDDYFRMYVSVIVTTAQLQVCTFDANRITLNDGRINDATFEPAPWIRFRKQLSNRIPTLAAGHGDPQEQLVRAKEQTVFVVNAEAFGQFLSGYAVDGDTLRPLH